MPGYTFQFAFEKSDDFYLNHEGKVCWNGPFSGDSSMCLSSYTGSKPLNACKELTLHAKGFDTEEAAYGEGKKAVIALMLCSLRHRMGLDLKRNKPPIASREETRGFIHKTDFSDIKNREMLPLACRDISAGPVQFVNDDGSILTYESDIQTIFQQAGPVEIITNSATGIDFTDELRFIFHKGLDIPEELYQAIDLYFLSHFEASSQSRLITLMITIESLLEQEAHVEEIVKHVEFLQEQTNKAKLAKTQIEDLIDRLNNLKYESINQAGQRFVEERFALQEYKGKKAKEFFKEAYGVRSSLVHGNKARKKRAATSAAGLVDELDRFVADVLLDEINPGYRSISTERKANTASS